VSCFQLVGILTSKYYIQCLKFKYSKPIAVRIWHVYICVMSNIKISFLCANPIVVNLTAILSKKQSSVNLTAIGLECSSVWPDNCDLQQGSILFYLIL
jgi:hypothetical protein